MTFRIGIGEFNTGLSKHKLVNLGTPHPLAPQHGKGNAPNRSYSITADAAKLRASLPTWQLPDSRKGSICSLPMSNFGRMICYFLADSVSAAGKIAAYRASCEADS